MSDESSISFYRHADSLKLRMSSLYGKFAERTDRYETDTRLCDKRTFFMKPKGAPAVITPDGHVFHRAYGPKVYECAFCSMLKQTRRGRPEYLRPTRRETGCPGKNDVRWSPTASRCPLPDIFLLDDYIRVKG